jgi:DUF2934 family protein
MNKLPTARAHKRATPIKVTTTGERATTNRTQYVVPADAARHAMIAEAAYYRAERRGFAPGFELEDWLQSENEQVALEKSSPSDAELH